MNAFVFYHVIATMKFIRRGGLYRFYDFLMTGIMEVILCDRGRVKRMNV